MAGLGSPEKVGGHMRSIVCILALLAPIPAQAACPNAAPEWNSIRHAELRAAAAQTDIGDFIRQAGSAREALNKIDQELRRSEDELARLRRELPQLNAIGGNMASAWRDQIVLYEDNITFYRGLRPLVGCRAGEPNARGGAGQAEINDRFTGVIVQENLSTTRGINRGRQEAAERAVGEREKMLRRATESWTPPRGYGEKEVGDEKLSEGPLPNLVDPFGKPVGEPGTPAEAEAFDPWKDLSPPSFADLMAQEIGKTRPADADQPARAGDDPCGKRARITAAIRDIEGAIPEVERAAVEGQANAWMAQSIALLEVAGGIADLAMDVWGEVVPEWKLAYEATKGGVALVQAGSPGEGLVAASRIAGTVTEGKPLQAAAGTLAAIQETEKGDVPKAAGEATSASSAVAQDLGKSLESSGLKKTAAALSAISSTTGVASGLDHYLAISPEEIRHRTEIVVKTMQHELSLLRKKEEEMTHACLDQSMPKPLQPAEVPR
jgi:hypothetical protein